VTDRDDAPRNDPGWTSPEGSEYEQEKRGAGAAEQGPPAETKDGKKGRPQVLPDSFTLLVVSK